MATMATTSVNTLITPYHKKNIDVEQTSLVDMYLGSSIGKKIENREEHIRVIRGENYTN